MLCKENVLQIQSTIAAMRRGLHALTEVCGYNMLTGLSQLRRSEVGPAPQLGGGPLGAPLDHMVGGHASTAHMEELAGPVADP